MNGLSEQNISVCIAGKSAFVRPKIHLQKRYISDIANISNNCDTGCYERFNKNTVGNPSS